MPLIRNEQLVGGYVPTVFTRYEDALTALRIACDAPARPATGTALANAIFNNDAPVFTVGAAKSAATVCRRLRLDTAPLDQLVTMFEDDNDDFMTTRQAHLASAFARDTPEGNFWGPPHHPHRRAELVSAFLVGQLHPIATDAARRGQLLEWGACNARHDGRPNHGAGHILSTGRALGRFFGLLNADDSPTPFYNTFYLG